MKRKIFSIFSILFALVLVVSFSLVAAVPVSANPGGIELVAKGDCTAEWTTEKAGVGSYSAKLTLPTGTMPSGTKNAEVQIDVSGKGLTLGEIDWSFWTLTPAGMESYALPIEFYVDINGNSTKIVAGNILKSSVPATDTWYEMTPELVEAGGCFYVWREDGTGFDWFFTWAKVVERWGGATLLRVDLGYGHIGTTQDITAYADDFTLTDTITYELEPSSVVSLSIETEQITAISVTPTSIDFGTIKPGDVVSGDIITVENIGTVMVSVGAELFPLEGTVFNCLTLNAGEDTAGVWSVVPNLAEISPSISLLITPVLVVPPIYSAQGIETAILTFVASPPAQG